MQPCQPHVTPGPRRLALLSLSLAAGLLACAALLLLVARPVWAAPAAVDRPYPGAAPCDTSLQACIDGATAGDTIVIAANTYITSFTLNKAVSLTGVASNTVILQALAGQRVLTVTGAAISNSVVISGLTFNGGDVTGGLLCPANCGGGLLLAGSAQPLLVNVIITGNRALLGGGLYAEFGSLVRMTDSHVLSNTSGFHGGGVHASEAVLNGGLFQGNQCTLDDCAGGGLYASSTLALTGTQFINNSARLSGGGVHADGALVLNGGLIQGNQCTQDFCAGGGLRANNSLALTGAQLISNTSRAYGGGALALGAAVLNGGLFEGNQCTRDDDYCQGGGLYANNTLALTGTQFLNNTARASGGGVYANNTAVLNGGLLQGNECTLDSCTGGGLFALTTLALTGTQFVSNTARAHGGGLLANEAAILNGGLFQGNQCTQVGCRGGGLFAVNTLALTGTQFLSNTALHYGGGAWANNTAVLNGGLFQGNRTTQDLGAGGGLYAYGTLTLTGTQFISNTARLHGGGVRADGASVLNGGLFQGNQCTQAGCQGGGFYLAGDAGHIVNTLFANNTALGSGAALYLNPTGDGNLSVVHSTIAMSTTQVITPAVHVAGGSVGITNTLFADHAIGIHRTGGSAFQDYNLFSNVMTPTTGGVSGGANSLTGTAAFVDAVGGDYHLTPASDAIDAGTNAGVLVDFEGQARPLGAGFDIGYDEWLARLYLPVVGRP